MISGFHDLDATAVLHTTEALVAEQRQREVDLLRLVLQWADLHAEDPGEGRVPGADQLVELGGEGTPPVQELCWAELAIARQAGVIATKSLAADALDLRHRLPLVWEAVQDLRLSAWVARKVASMSRQLSADAVGLVDVAVAAAVDQSPGRILAIAEAKVIEADIEAHRARLVADAAKVGVRLSAARPGAAVDTVDGEPATLRVTLKLAPGTALGFDASVNEVADAIYDQLPDDDRNKLTRGELEAKAVELLSNPHAAAAFLDEVNNPTPPSAEGEPVVPKPKKRPLVKTRTLLRLLGDAFPHSSSLGYRRLDHDHATPYFPSDRGGPPGQTGDHNDAPLTRTHHRVKTHNPGYDVHQLGLGAYRWVTPHGLARLVTTTGTRRIDVLRDKDGRVAGEIYYSDSGPAPPSVSAHH